METKSDPKIKMLLLYRILFEMIMTHWDDCSQTVWIEFDSSL